MNLLRFRISVPCCIALVLLLFSRSTVADSYCPGCKAGVIGAAVGVGVVAGIGIYFVHRSHTSLTGCVQQANNGLSLTAKDGKIYELVNAPSEVKASQRFSLRGHKMAVSSGQAFRVDNVSHDYGACVP